MEKYNYCPKCGSKQSGSPKFCFECGNEFKAQTNEPIDLKFAYIHIESAIENLVLKSGILIITINKDKVILSKRPESFKLKISIDESILDENKTFIIKSLSYHKNNNHFEKEYILDYTDKVINNIVNELSTLFQLETGIEFDHEPFSEKVIPKAFEEPIVKEAENITTNPKLLINQKKRILDPLTIIIIIGFLIIGGALLKYHFEHIPKDVEISNKYISDKDYIKTKPVFNDENIDNSTNDKKKNLGRLVGVWPDPQLAKDMDFPAAYKFVLSDDGKLYFSSCDMSEEKLEIGAKSELITISELVWNGKEFVDMHLPDQRFKINKSGDLIISDQLGKIGVFAKSFIDPTVLKF
ncbi:zinc ribbon domain-containing protein [Sphingobacterium sp. 1.A.5]|uniref:zinc ribbon domain-containing protein n=1 Tax=Sphingobacterium sp. 1.A.5 TaxID=2044604 RepID=UPI000C0BD6E5|nr:zinc ribbon domain-containing protein [Sphingobacterium sp. 1.A.5]